MIATAEQIERANAKDYKRLVELLSKFSRATIALTKMQARVDKAQLEAVTKHLGKYTTLQRIQTETESALEQLARQHPEWFPKDKRNVTTPCGVVKMHESNPLVVKNKEITLALLDERAAKDPSFNLKLYLNIERTPNLSTLATWTDEELMAIGIEREKKDNFSVTATKVNMGKSVKTTKPKVAKEAK